MSIIVEPIKTFALFLKITLTSPKLIANFLQRIGMIWMLWYNIINYFGSENLNFQAKPAEPPVITTYITFLDVFGLFWRTGSVQSLHL